VLLRCAVVAVRETHSSFVRFSAKAAQRI